MNGNAPGDRLKSLIRTVADYPRKGVRFRDITTLLKDAEGFRLAVDTIVDRYRGQRIDKVAAIESRGFMIGAPVARQLGAGFVPIRKKGKLPHETLGHEYALEYGSDGVEIHVDAIRPGERVLLVDDLVATGGTAEAAATLVGRLGGEVVECCFVIDLPALGGRRRLERSGQRVHALCSFEDG
jgi:adenine phosphoribosyltransferase